MMSSVASLIAQLPKGSVMVISSRIDISLRFSFSPTPIYTFLQATADPCVGVWKTRLVSLALGQFEWQQLTALFPMSRKGKAGEEGGCVAAESKSCMHTVAKKV